MKRMAAQVNHTEIDIDTDIDIEHINFDLSQESDDQALIISYLQGKATEELGDVWINSTMSHSQAFAEKYEGNVQDEQIDLKEAVPTELHEYLDVFSDENASRFPKSTPWDHKIELKEGFQPKSFKIYPMTPEEDAMTKEFIDDNLEKGFIRPSKSPMATPFFFIHKKGTAKKRPCQDYRYLNNWTVKNAYPLPLISDIMDKVKNAKYFTKMDVRLGYNNVRIHEGDEWKGAFKTKYGLFEPLVMFFGLCNSPATFQHMMDNIFIVQTAKGWMIIYMDDMLIFAETKEELTERTLEVLQLLRENDLYLKPQKCKFYVTRVEFLGFIIEDGKMIMDPIKLAGIADWPAPTTLRQLRSFLGFGNFYRKFIHHYSDLT